ncbi:hypothetical protein AQPE_0607 [Aquipluma nitroreducens]|uniref:Uncharacterized protein n=1 Tax=Aquipluma nitroreducens TaxID=2010828 RepID=A0A5K7S4P1_9BACT|nr:hypothetical protein AQPE_0607 [Aquipluma nitroreducens]
MKNTLEIFMIATGNESVKFITFSAYFRLYSYNSINKSFGF